MTIDFSSAPRRGARIRFRVIADEAVVLDQENRRILVLNEIGGRLLDLLDGSRTLGEIAERIDAEYSAPMETIRRDVLAFTHELVDHGLVDLEASEGPKGS